MFLKQSFPISRLYFFSDHQSEEAKVIDDRLYSIIGCNTRFHICTCVCFVIICSKSLRLLVPREAKVCHCRSFWVSSLISVSYSKETKSVLPPLLTYLYRVDSYHYYYYYHDLQKFLFLMQTLCFAINRSILCKKKKKKKNIEKKKKKIKKIK